MHSDLAPARGPSLVVDGSSGAQLGDGETRRDKRVGRIPIDTPRRQTHRPSRTECHIRRPPPASILSTALHCTGRAPASTHARSKQQQRQENGAARATREGIASLVAPARRGRSLAIPFPSPHRGRPKP